MKARMQLVALVASTVLVTPALAQTSSTPNTAQPGSSTAAPNAEAAKPMAAGQAATASQGSPSQIRYVTQNRRDLWRASKLEGVDVYNDKNEKIGDIAEVLVDRQGKVEAVVIGVGGFLGIGQRDVAVPFDQLRWQVVERQNTAGLAGAAPRDTNTTASTAAKMPAATNAPPAGSTVASAPAMNRDDRRIADTRYDQTRDYPARAVLAGATKDQLKNAPEFQYAK